MSTLAGIDGTRIIVLVLDVDLENRLASCQDKTKATLKVSFRDGASGSLRIPTQGDRWTAVRSGATWRFESRIDQPQDHIDLVDNMAPGDTRIDSSGDVHVLGDGVLFNNQPVGATTYSIFTPDGLTTAFTLAIEPVHPHSVQAFDNGVMIDPRTFTVAGAVVNFPTPPTPGTLYIYYQRAGFVYEDDFISRAIANISGVELGPVGDSASVISVGAPSAVGAFQTNIVLGGNEITDATRTAGAALGTGSTGQMEDGFTVPAGVGIHRAATNLFRRGQCGVTTDWNPASGGEVIATDATVPPPFSTQSIKVTTNSVLNQGVRIATATAQAAVAGTNGVGSVYFKGVAGQSYMSRLQWGNTDASSTSGAFSTFTATGAWQLITPAGIAVAVGKTGDVLSIYVQINGTRTESYWVAHGMLEAGFVFVAPYVTTSGGTTATHAAGRIQQ